MIKNFTLVMVIFTKSMEKSSLSEHLPIRLAPPPLFFAAISKAYFLRVFTVIFPKLII